MASVVPSIQIKVNSGYKGGTREWSNRYSFNGTLPPDSTHWTTLATAVVNAFKPCIDNQHTIVEAIGYAAGSDVPVFSEVLSVAGTLTPTGTAQGAPLETAALIRWTTASRSTKNHPIYAFSYIHGAAIDNSHVYYELLWATQRTALATFASDWVSGFSDGAVNHVRCTPAGHVATGSLVEEYVTHRDFPYQSSV